MRRQSLRHHLSSDKAQRNRSNLSTRNSNGISLRNASHVLPPQRPTSSNASSSNSSSKWATAAPANSEICRRPRRASRKKGRLHHDVLVHQGGARVRHETRRPHRPHRRRKTRHPHDRPRPRRHPGGQLRSEAHRLRLLRRRVSSAPKSRLSSALAPPTFSPCPPSPRSRPLLANSRSNTGLICSNTLPKTPRFKRNSSPACVQPSRRANAILPKVVTLKSTRKRNCGNFSMTSNAAGVLG